MIESEAKTKLCCGPADCGEKASTGAPYFHHAGRRCVGSDCMAWRQDVPVYKKGIKMLTVEGYNNIVGPEKVGWELLDGGDCGLVK